MTALVNGLGGAVDFGENSVAATDDGSSALIDITGVFGGNLNFFGQQFGGLYVNNNGNITFNSTLSAFTPFGISNSTFLLLLLISVMWIHVREQLHQMVLAIVRGQI